MPAVFQIVSRSSGKALARTTPAPQQPAVDFTSNIVQSTQNDQDLTQMWVLTPQDSAADCLIQPFGTPDLAIVVFATDLQDTDFPGSPLIIGPAQAGQVWRISRRLASPPYFFLLEANNDLVMDVPDELSVQIFTRTEHNNQQWTFLPVFAQLRKAG